MKNGLMYAYIITMLSLLTLGTSVLFIGGDADAHEPEECECVCECPELPVLICEDGSEPFNIEELEAAAEGSMVLPAPTVVVPAAPAPNPAKQEAVRRALEAIERVEEYEAQHPQQQQEQ